MSALYTLVHCSQARCFSTPAPPHCRRANYHGAPSNGGRQPSLVAGLRPSPSLAGMQLCLRARRACMVLNLNIYSPCGFSSPQAAAGRPPRKCVSSLCATSHHLRFTGPTLRRTVPHDRSARINLTPRAFPADQTMASRRHVAP